jgi:hypothetical protein
MSDHIPQAWPTLPRHHHGVIVGIDPSTSPETVERIAEAVRNIFPTVRFAFVGGAQSVAFPLEES